MSTPKVSVVMAVHNGSAYLEESIQSTLGQTFQDFELIVIDDCSTDRSWDMLKDFAAADPRVVLLQNSQNLGLAASLNRGLEVAQGDYIARMDDDDVALPQRLQRQVDYLDQHADIALVSTGVQYIDIAGQALDLYCPPLDPLLLRWHLVYGSPLRHPTVLWRRAAVAAVVRGYNPENRYAEDYEFFCEVSRELKVAALAAPLLKMRKRPGSVTLSKGREQDEFSAQVAYRQLDYYFADSPLTDTEKFQLRTLLRRYSFFQKHAFQDLSPTDFGQAANNYLRLFDQFKTIHSAEIQAHPNSKHQLFTEIESNVSKLLAHCLRRKWLGLGQGLLLAYLRRHPERTLAMLNNVSTYFLGKGWQRLGFLRKMGPLRTA